MPSGVMTHTMILEIMMQVISLLLLLSKDCVLYSTCIALFLLCMQCVCTQSFSSSLMAATMIHGITMLAIWCNDSHHDPGDHDDGHLGNTSHLVLLRITRCWCLEGRVLCTHAMHRAPPVEPHRACCAALRPLCVCVSRGKDPRSSK